MAAEKLQKVTLKLFDGEFEKLRQHYPEVGASLVVRKLVRNHLRKLEALGSNAEIEVELEA